MKPICLVSENFNKNRFRDYFLKFPQPKMNGNFSTSVRHKRSIDSSCSVSGDDVDGIESVCCGDDDDVVNGDHLSTLPFNLEDPETVTVSCKVSQSN